MASPCNYLAYPELDWNLGFPRLEPVSTIFYARARCSYCAPINLQSTNLHNVGLQLRVGSGSLSKFVLVLSINARACTPCPPQTWNLSLKRLLSFVVLCWSVFVRQCFFCFLATLVALDFIPAVSESVGGHSLGLQLSSVVWSLRACLIILLLCHT